MAGKSTSAKWREHDEALRRLWTDGLSAAEIAAQLGSGITRNGVIGRVHRLGIAARSKKSARKSVARPAAAAPVVAPPPAAPRHRPEPARAPAILPLSPASDTGDVDGVVGAVVSLRAGRCKFPSGDVRSGDLTFCGAPVRGDGPYCGAHAQIAYTPPRKFVPRSKSAPSSREGVR